MDLASVKHDDTVLQTSLTDCHVAAAAAVISHLIITFCWHLENKHVKMKCSRLLDSASNCHGFGLIMLHGRPVSLFKRLNCGTGSLCCGVVAGISGVKSREDLVMSNTDLSSTDPFGAAPFKPPAGISAVFPLLSENLLYCCYLNNSVLI